MIIGDLWRFVEFGWKAKVYYLNLQINLLNIIRNIWIGRIFLFQFDWFPSQIWSTLNLHQDFSQSNDCIALQVHPQTSWSSLDGTHSNCYSNRRSKLEQGLDGRFYKVDIIFCEHTRQSSSVYETDDGNWQAGLFYPKGRWSTSQRCPWCQWCYLDLLN